MTFGKDKSSFATKPFLNNATQSTYLNDYENGVPVEMNIVPFSERFFSSESGFGIYTCYEEDKDDDIKNRFVIKGSFVSQLLTGQTYNIKGNVSTNFYNGINEKQIKVNTIRTIKPSSRQGIIKYLKTLKGLKSKAELIYDTYAENSINMILNDPLEVSKNVKGVGKKVALKWQEQLKELVGSQETITRLLDYGLTIKQARKLYDKYSDNILQIIENNPYCLAAKVKGYAFKSCDRIAINMGYDLTSRFRISECIIYVLEEAQLEGHCYLPLPELISRAQDALSCKLNFNEMVNIANRNEDIIEHYVGKTMFKVDRAEVKRLLELYTLEKDYDKKENYKYRLLDIKEEEIILQFEELKTDKRITVIQKDDIKVYLTSLYYDELSVAYNILRLSQESKFNNLFKLEEELDYYLESSNITLESQQRKAVLDFANSKGGFHILNGSAGCGKTFVLKIILSMLRLQYQKSHKKIEILIYAPTGKASKVAAKATQMPCSTVHRGLGFSPKGGFEYNKENPLKADVIVIDESSMLDISLTRYLLEAIKSETKVIFIGDIKQLPSVGPGNVLKDMIESEEVKTVTLNVVKRQDLLSDILKNANNIVNKQMLVNYGNTNDAFVIFKEQPFETQEYIIKSIERVQKVKGYNLEDIQVLCPQKTSAIGTITMNYLIQQKFNPGNNELVAFNKKFILKTSQGDKEVSLNYKKGDKVIHIKNNYEMEWYEKITSSEYVKCKNFIGITNGETGVIEDIIKKKENNGDGFIRIIVRYDDKYVFYDDTFDELEHAFALTIHKSQGSQWKAVIIPVMYQNFRMLDNNLLYTAYTRAEEFNVVIGQQKAIAYAINNSRIITRYTDLKNKLVVGV